MPSADDNLTHDFLPDPNATGDVAPLPMADAAVPAVPGYEIAGVLGRGGMGVVYDARHLQLNRRVALKMVLAGQHADAERLVRFLHEAELLARVQHPNVVGIYDVGRHAGLPYFALEHCPGGTLHARLNGTPLPPREAATLAAKLARAVQAAHAVGVIHRDLKPANVLLAADGTPKLADFGLARFAELERHLTQTGQVLGTPAYMAPEQAAGASDVGPLADVYGLGAMLYCFLTGRPPHQAATPHETIGQVLRDDPANPRSLQPGLPRDLETITLKALDKRPERRYATAAALADDLERWLAGDTITARPASSVEKAVKWAKRRPTMATLVVMTAVFVSAFVASVTTLWLKMWEEQDKVAKASGEVFRAKADLGAEQIQNKATAARLDLEQKEARRATSLSKLLASQSYWERGNVTQAKANLNAVAPTDRHMEWHYLDRHYRGDFVELPVRGSIFALSHDASRCVTADNETLIVRSTATCEPLAELRGRANSVWAAAFADDGRRVAFTDRLGVTLWDTATGRVDDRAVPGAERFAFSPGGRWLASAGADTVRVLDTATKAIVRTIDAQTGTMPLAVSASGVVSIGGGPFSQWATVYDPNRGDAGANVTSIPGVMTNQFDHSADGKTVLARCTPRPSTAAAKVAPRFTIVDESNRGERLWVCDAVTSLPRVELADHDSVAECVAFSPDGQAVAVGMKNGTVRLWDLFSGRCLATVRGFDQAVTMIAVSADARRVTFGNGNRLVCWDRARADSWNALSASGLIAWAVSRDGAAVLAGYADHAVRRWDMSTGFATRQFQATLPGDVGFDRLLVAPDGRRILASVSLVPTLFDASAGRPVSPADGVEATAMAFSPDGSRYAVTGGGWLTVHRSADGQPLTKIHGVSTSARYVTFSPDGRHVLAASAAEPLIDSSGPTIYDDQPTVWDSDTGVRRRRYVVRPSPDREGQWAFAGPAAFSSDGTKLHVAWATEHASGVQTLDATSGAVVATLAGHAGGIAAVAVTPDGERVVTAGRDRTVRVWDARGNELLTLKADVSCEIVTLFPGGMAAGCQADFSHDAAVRFWDTTPAGDVVRRVVQYALNPDWHDVQARAAVEAQRWDAALFHFRRADRLPGPLPVRALLATALAAAGRRDAAALFHSGQPYVADTEQTLRADNRAATPGEEAFLRSRDRAEWVAATLDRLGRAEASRVGWARLAGQQARVLKRLGRAAAESECVKLAHYHLLSGRPAAGAAAARAAQQGYAIPHLVTAFAAMVGRSVGDDATRAVALAADAAGWGDRLEYLDYLVAGALPLPAATLCLSRDPQMHLLLALRGRAEARPLSDAEIGSLDTPYKAVAEALRGNVGAARDAVAAIDRDIWFSYPNAELLRREALALIAALEAKPKP